jgi:hypothetical protein
MKRIIQLYFFCLTSAALVMAQEPVDIAKSWVANSDISFNDQGVGFIQSENHWEAIQAFERSMRIGGKQGRVAKRNVAKFRKQVDLPAHNLLQFGWAYGIGKAANVMVRNGWLILSLMLAAAIILYYFIVQHWSWWKVIALGGLSVLTLSLSYYQALYVEAADLIIFQKDTDLKEKPYDVSDEKQVVFAGQMGKIEQSYEGYYLVQTDTYETGWVAQEDTAPVW